MNITPQQARVELAKRELSKRGKSVSQDIQPGFDSDQQTLKANQVENAISNRPSNIDVNLPINPINLTPFGGSKMLPESGRALAGGMEIAEGIPADIGLAIQGAVGSKGKSLKKLPMDIVKTLTGKRPAEFGDIYRASNVPVLSSEPVASTGGLLTSASNITPSGAAGNKVGEAIGKFFSPAGKSIKRGVGKGMSALSGVPEKSMQTAMDNPEVLNKGYLEKEAKAAGQEYSSKVDPLIQDNTAVSKITPKASNLSKDLKLYTPQGSETRVLSTMENTEKGKVLDWLKRLDNGSGQVDFNELDKIVGEIDTELQPAYRQAARGSQRPIPADNFDRVAGEIRKSADEIRKSSQFGTKETIDRYSALKLGQQANKDFSKFLPKNAAYKGFIDYLISHFNLPLAGGIAAASSPMLQGAAIKTAGKIGSELGAKPALTLGVLAKKKRN